MAGCLIITGITRSDSTCNGTFGGLLKVYLGNKAQLTSVAKNSSDVITGVTMSSSGKAYEFQFEEEVGAALIEALIPESGFVTQTVNFTLQNIDQTKKQILSKLKRSRAFAVIQMPNGKLYLAGETGFGLKTKTLEITSGQAATDIAQATLSLEGNVLDFADEITSTAAATIIV